MPRPRPEACPTGDTFPPDAAPTVCSKDADCADAGATIRGAALACFHGQCSYDQCATDQDCPSGDVCNCKGNPFGWAVSAGNSCLPANCRSDGDCGPGGWCAPTVSSGCGPFYGVQGYYCHTCNDACIEDNDCAQLPRGASFTAPYCAYDTTVGQWVCSNGFCAG